MSATIRTVLFIGIALAAAGEARAQINCSDADIQRQVAEASTNALWQWDNGKGGFPNPEGRPFVALETYLNGNDGLASIYMENGQLHNLAAARTYTAYRLCKGVHAFWEMVASVSHRPTCDLSEAKTNIEWQVRHRYDTIGPARSALLGGGIRHLEAVWHLLKGQDGSPGVQDLYRVCFAQKRNEFLLLV